MREKFWKQKCGHRGSQDDGSRNPHSKKVQEKKIPVTCQQVMNQQPSSNQVNRQLAM